jgi:N-acetylmuramoyl-L-alanine amidase
MKFAGYAFAVTLVVGLTGFRMWARPQHLVQPESPLSSTLNPGPSVPSEGGADAVGGNAAGGLEEAEEFRPTPPPQEVPRARSSRQRGRNRYPGPIPTPAEWEPPAGPVRIGLQAGHWRANEAPAELSGLQDNGTAWRGTPEWEVNLGIAREAGAMLEDLGYQVDILPAVVPPSYRAHLFISIHADGSNDPSATGFRVAGPRQDATGRASGFVGLLEQSYGEATGLRRLPTVTHRMQNYYAFNFRRYEHALHPMTIGVILETGFLTSSRDRGVIVDDPGRAARGIVEAVKAFPVTPPPVSTLR